MKSWLRDTLADTGGGEIGGNEQVCTRIALVARGQGGGRHTLASRRRRGG